MEDITAILEDIHAQLADLNTRVSRLESREPVAAEPPPAPKLAQDKLLAISAAIAAFLGERVRIRQIRLVSSTAWAQQGRVSVQASHHLRHE